MENIIPPIDRELLIQELTEERLVRKTNAGNNLIYIVNHFNAPNVTKEIGRLREITFRDAGGGTGLSVDLDYYDTCEDPFEQLIVWNPDDQEIIGGYRYLHCKFLKKGDDGTFHTPTFKLFRYSQKFVDEYLPYTIELGRSFVQPAYQPANNIRKGMYSLDNIWDGLGAIILLHPDIRYYFGKITMYPDYNRQARDLILYFMEKYFADPEKLVYPIEPLLLDTDEETLANSFPNDIYDKDYKLLIQKVRALGETIPPLVNAYMNLSSTMKFFGTAINDDFGLVEESGIIVTISDIYDMKIERHLTIPE
ncbi:MAG: GNAT family N-acetyltransferase [Bacteroidales bacterium]|nr:GNAT family N-acetyltransferase [Bacteroidales bacterium]